MNKTLLNEEITQLNRRFSNLCLRSYGPSETEICLSLNISLSYLRALRALNTDQVESLVQTPFAMVMPAIEGKCLRTAAEMTDAQTRMLYLQSTWVGQHGG